MAIDNVLFGLWLSYLNLKTGIKWACLYDKAWAEVYMNFMGLKGVLLGRVISW